MGRARIALFRRLLEHLVKIRRGDIETFLDLALGAPCKEAVRQLGAVAEERPIEGSGRFFGWGQVGPCKEKAQAAQVAARAPEAEVRDKDRPGEVEKFSGLA